MRGVAIAMILVGAFATPASAQAPADGKALYDTLLARDAELFSIGFDRCDPPAMAAMLVDDLEFYHDKDGVVATSAEQFVADYARKCESRKTSAEPRSRRELVAGSMTVHPMEGYGAIQQGEHLFYERRGDGLERLAGRARFTHLWKNDSGVWKLARVLSYDHQAAEPAR